MKPKSQEATGKAWSITRQMTLLHGTIVVFAIAAVILMPVDVGLSVRLTIGGVLGFFAMIISALSIRMLVVQRVKSALAIVQASGNTQMIPTNSEGMFGSKDELHQLITAIDMHQRLTHEEEDELTKTNNHLRDEMIKQTSISLERERLLRSRARSHLLGELAAGIAHEINNPVTIIIGKAELLESELSGRNALSEKSQKMLEQIRHTAEKISRIVRSMNMLGKDTSTEEFQPLHLGDFCSDVVALAEFRARKKHVEFKHSIENPTAVIWIKKLELAQALSNLIHNAVSAVADSEDAWISFTAKAVEHTTVFRVTDSGKISNPTILQRLKTPFFSKDTKPEFDGLGLNISASIAMEHGGSIFYNTKSPTTEFVCEIKNAVVEFEEKLMSLSA